MSNAHPNAATSSRRHLLCAGLAAAAGLSVESLLAAELHPQGHTFDSVEAQKFPWGSIRWLMSDKIEPGAELTLGIVEIEANQANPLHIHPNCEEILHVLSGSLEHRLGDAWATLKVGDTLRIPKNAVHGARTKQDKCRVIVVYNTGARQMTPVKDIG